MLRKLQYLLCFSLLLRNISAGWGD
ncbi:RepA leader peptide Tap [Enterobacter sp. 22466]